MTRKHYELIAEAIRQARNDVKPFYQPTPEAFIGRLIDRLVTALSNDNPRFNEEVFREACISK